MGRTRLLFPHTKPHCLRGLAVHVSCMYINTGVCTYPNSRLILSPGHSISLMPCTTCSKDLALFLFRRILIDFLGFSPDLSTVINLRGVRRSKAATAVQWHETQHTMAAHLGFIKGRNAISSGSLLSSSCAISSSLSILCLLLLDCEVPVGRTTEIRNHSPA